MSAETQIIRVLCERGDDDVNSCVSERRGAQIQKIKPLFVRRN